MFEMAENAAVGTDGTENGGGSAAAAGTLGTSTGTAPGTETGAGPESALSTLRDGPDGGAGQEPGSAPEDGAKQPAETKPTPKATSEAINRATERYQKKLNYYQSRDAEVSRLLKEANLPEDIGEAAAQIVATVKGIPVEQARAQQTMMRDLTLLGDADAREIIENGDIETELARLEKKPLHLRSTRDKQCFLRLSEAKALNDSAAELEKRGVDVEALRKNQAFADFGRKLSPELPIAEKYDLFKKLTQPAPAQVTPPPSVKNAGGTAKKEFYTPDEVDRMSKEEVNANLDAITKSMASKTNGW